MPRLIIKPNHDVDFYVEWSTIVDSPIRSGPRAWMMAELGATAGAAERFDRADEYGSSAREWFGYDDKGLITGEPLREQRWLLRGNLAAYAKAIARGDIEEAMALTESIEE